MIVAGRSHRALTFAGSMPPASLRPISEARLCSSNVRTDWGVVKVADGLLRLSEVLPAGQSFRWKNAGPVRWSGFDDGLYQEWIGVISDAPVILREPDPPSCSPPAVVYLQVSNFSKAERAGRIRELCDYLRSDVDLTEAYARFCASDPAFRAAHERHPGCRMLRQPPTETTFGFICSSNNNIRRIEGMMQRLGSLYGERVGEHQEHELYSFPSAETLATRADEAELRAASFGYRAKFIVGTAKALVARAKRDGCSAEEFLLSLRTRSREEVEEELCAFPGIGRKVAGCIALMSLDCHGAIPVDTHVWKIAKKHMPNLNSKTLTPRIYNEIGDWFRAKYGEEDAGIAHNTLFLEELSDFKPGDKKSKPKNTKKKRRSKEAKNDDVDLESKSEKKARPIRVKEEEKKTQLTTVCKEEEVKVKSEEVVESIPCAESSINRDMFKDLRRRKPVVVKREVMPVPKLEDGEAEVGKN